MTHMTQPNLQLLYNEVRLAALYDALDELHGAASEGVLSTTTTLSNVELMGWLREIVYTAQETIAEMDKHSAGSGIYLIKKSS